MSDELKKLYEKAGLLTYYFDKEIPRDLFRGQNRTEKKQGLPILYPNLGFVRKDGKTRPADVLIFERDGKKFVAGCRCVHGDYRGISTFDRKNMALPSFSWFKLPKGTQIPTALAVTQESNNPNIANHFSIAPKDDMPLELFEQWLKMLNDKLIEDS